MGGCLSTSRGEEPMVEFTTKPMNNTATPPAGTVGVFCKPDKTELTHDLPPTYAPTEMPKSVNSILQMFKGAQNFHCGSIGVKGGLDVLRHRKVQVWVDDNTQLPKQTKEAIMFLSMMLLTLGKAFGSNMEICFTGYSNNNVNKFSEAKRKRAAALSNLFNTETYDEAVAMIESEPDLRHEDLRLDAWLQETEKSRRRFDTSTRNSTLPQSGKEKVTSRPSDEETHLKLLAQVRQLRTLYWQGWHQRDLKVEKFPELYKEAVAATSQQPKSLNNLRFTIERVMALQRRLHEGTDAQSTSVLILTASPLVEKEANAIKMDQAEVRGGADEFSIQTLLLCDKLNPESIGIHRLIDNNCKGDKDIYDVSELSEEEVLKYGLSVKQLVKALNSSIRAVDGMKFKNDKDKYGPSALGDGNQPILPSVEQTKEELGL